MPGQRTFYRLASLLLVVFVLYEAQIVLIPVALAILFAFALTPPAAWLERFVGRVASALIMTAAALAVVAGLGWVAYTQVRQLGESLPAYGRNITRKVEPVQKLLEGLERAERLGAPDPVEQPGGQPADPTNPIPGQPIDQTKGPVPVTVVPPKGSQALAWLPTLAGPAVEILANALLVTVLTVFMLIQRESVRDRVLSLAGRRQLTATTRALEDASGRVSKYLLLQTSTNAAMGAVVWLGLWAVGVPYAPLWGLLTAALRFVPYVGIWLAALFPFALAVGHFDGWWEAVMVLAVFAGFDLVLANVIEPLLFGHGTGVSALSLLVAATFWAFLWGPIGLLLAIPLTVCLAVLGEHIPSLKFLGTILGDEPQVDAAARYFHRVLARQFDQAAMLAQEQAAGRPLLDVYDDMILPALAQAKAERDSGDLARYEERAFYQVTEDVLTGVLARVREEAGAKDGPARPTALAVGCATKGEADRLALGMLRDVAREGGGDLDVVRAGEFVSAVRDRVKADAKVVAVIAAVSPGGLAVAAGLCKRLRANHPDLTVVIGRWGMTADSAETEKLLLAAGATKVTWKLRETLAEIVPNLPPPAKDAVDTPAGPGETRVPA